MAPHPEVFDVAKDPNWIGGVREGMERRGTVGAFTRQAKAAGATVPRFAARVLSNPGGYTRRTVRRARFARTMEEIGAKRSGKSLPPILRLTARPKRKRTRRKRTKRAA